MIKTAPWDLNTRGNGGRAPTDASGKPIYDPKSGSTSGTSTPLARGQFQPEGGLAAGHPTLDQQAASRNARSEVGGTTDLPNRCRVDSAIETSLGRHLGQLGVQRMDLRGPAGGAPLFDEVGPASSRQVGMHHLGNTPGAITPDPGAARIPEPLLSQAVRQWDDPPRDASVIGPTQATQGAGQNR